MARAPANSRRSEINLNKAIVHLHVRVSEGQKEAYRMASGGNISAFVKRTMDAVVMGQQPMKEDK